MTNFPSPVCPDYGEQRKLHPRYGYSCCNPVCSSQQTIASNNASQALQNPCKTPGCPNRAIIDDDYCPEHMKGTKHSKKVFDAMNCRMVVLLNSDDQPICYRVSDKHGKSIELGIVGLSDLEGLIAQAKRQQEAAGL